MNIFRSISQNTAFRIQFLPLIISFTLLFSMIIIASTPPITGYKLSIYDAYPGYLWLLISINIFFSIFAILRSCGNQVKISYIGYFSILLIETTIIFLPIIRGYVSMSGVSADLFHHMFIASQISNSGYFPMADIYPIMHIWLSLLHNFFPEFIILTLILSIVFFISYILFLYIFGKTILGTKNGGIFVSIFGIPLVFSYGHYAFYPFLFALFVIPLILYAYHKITHNFELKNPFFICLILLSFFIVFCHPMITVFLIIMFAVFACYELIKKWNTSSGQSSIVAANILIILSITFIFWLFHIRSLIITIENIIFALFGKVEYVSIIEAQVDTLPTSNPPILLIIDRFIKIYGPISLYFLISFFFLIYVTYQYIHYKKINEDDFIFSIQYCVAICIGFALATGYFVIFEPIRAAMYGLIFATILCGLFFYRMWLSGISKKRRLVLITMISFIFSIVCMITMLTIYASPWISGANSARTYEDKNGFDWILEYRNEEIPISIDQGRISPYLTYYYESISARKFQNFSYYYPWVPSHFGYNSYSTIGESFADLPVEEVYMTTPESMKVAPYSIPIERRIVRYSDTDFTRLKNDPTVKLVYSSNEFEVWNIALP